MSKQKVIYKIKMSASSCKYLKKLSHKDSSDICIKLDKLSHLHSGWLDGYEQSGRLPVLFT